MDVRRLVLGCDYIVLYGTYGQTKKQYIATLTKKGSNGWHDFKLKSQSNGGSLGTYMKDKKVPIASRSVLSAVMPTPTTTNMFANNTKPKLAAKPKRPVDLKKELDAVILMFEKFDITVGLDPNSTGLIIDVEEIPRLRRVLARMFGKQLGL